ncbi:threonine dehydratase [Nonomuraea rubra]|uniref:threonine ammonia-lyase n=1 Tax=Nonomuraea rubra TaxID=46180 RepID=A0A7X0TX85_9ACTN|nr:threonine dehydratase [Nonomuraea rubra]
MNTTTAMPLERIREAESAVSARLAVTPLVELRGLTTPEGRTILIKAEGLQPTGSFKVRGALNRIVRLSEAERAAGVVAYSTGNHAQAVAWAARAFGIAAAVVMSPEVPHNKVEATRRLGADVVMAAATSDARRAMAERLAHERGAALVAPYDDLNVIAGQATVATEILRQTHHEPPAAPSTCRSVEAGCWPASLPLSSTCIQPHRSSVSSRNWRRTHGAASGQEYCPGSTGQASPSRTPSRSRSLDA